jgi:hypothetical protein
MQENIFFSVQLKGAVGKLTSRWAAWHQRLEEGTSGGLRGSLQEIHPASKKTASKKLEMYVRLAHFLLSPLQERTSGRRSRLMFVTAECACEEPKTPPNDWWNSNEKQPGG